MYNYEETSEERKRKLSINLSYPKSLDYDFYCRVEIIDFDKERDEDIKKGKGFIISAPKPTTKKEMKSPDGIYSPRFGQRIGDQNPFSDRYTCDCGYLKGRINHSITCPQCNTKCRFIDDKMDIFGWIVLNDEYHIIHPKFYDTLNAFMGQSAYNVERKKIKGTRLENAINYSPEVDCNGFISDCKFKPDKEPFFGIGMIEFYNRFDEIIEYYYKLNPAKKQAYYDELLKYRDIVFTHSIPVFTTHLRPSDIADGFMFYEPSNALYNIINKHVHSINNTKRKLNQNITHKNQELYKVQMKFMELVNLELDLMSGKKGRIRSLLGGRYNFSSRCVIRQDATLRANFDQPRYIVIYR